MWTAKALFSLRNQTISPKNLLFAHITKTLLYSFAPLNLFYTVKLGLQGYKLIFLFLLKNGEAVLTSTHILCFKQKYENYQNFLSESFHFLLVKSQYIWIGVFS